MTHDLPTVASLDQLLSAHQRIRSDLSKQVVEINAREAALRAELDACFAQRASLEEQLRALDTAGELYRKMLGRPAAPETVQVPHWPLLVVKRDITADTPKPPRARIGPQRYQMFIALRELGSANRLQIATMTNLSEKRVREQMLSDINGGFVSENASDEMLSLTPEGMSLLERFEMYQKLKGKRLAQLGDAADDADDLGDSESEETEDKNSSVSPAQQQDWTE